MLYVAGVEAFVHRPGGFLKVEKGSRLFVNFAEDPDPAAFGADEFARIERGDLCTRHLSIFASNSRMGCFSGPLQPDKRTGTVVLSLQPYPPGSDLAATSRGKRSL